LGWQLLSVQDHDRLYDLRVEDDPSVVILLGRLGDYEEEDGGVNAANIGDLK